MSLANQIQEYIRVMLDRVSGMKVLVLDAETTGIISTVYSQSAILEHEVFLVERIDDHKEKMKHLNAVCFLRPTNQNFLLLSKELRVPNYNEYHLFFTNMVPHNRLENLAACDELEVVRQVHEFFADVYVVNRDLFSLNMPSTIGLTQEQTSWTTYEENLFQRTVEGLLSVMLSQHMMPTIRFTRSSELTRKIAAELQHRITSEHSLFDDIQRKSQGSQVLLIVDRRDDPLTPLLNQWTYQAMVHELIGIDNNRVDMQKAPGIRPELKEIVLSVLQDTFFEENLTSNFGDLGLNVKQYVDQYQEQTKSTAKIESIEDMQRFVDEYPEFRKLSGNVSKHVAVVHELSRLVDAGNLLDVSSDEQDIATTEAKADHLRAVMEKIQLKGISNMERLRLVLIFSLRYEHDLASISQLKAELSNAGVDSEQIRLVDWLLEYAGSHVRGGDLFKNKNLLAMARNTIQRNFKGVQNVYTQHTSMLLSTVDKLMKGTLQENVFPIAPGNYGSSKERPTEALVFMIGGATFEEARDMTHLNASLTGQRVILGGSTIHNSKSFLADIAQLGRRGHPDF